VTSFPSHAHKHVSSANDSGRLGAQAFKALAHGAGMGLAGGDPDEMESSDPHSAVINNEDGQSESNSAPAGSHRSNPSLPEGSMPTGVASRTYFSSAGGNEDIEMNSAGRPPI